MKYTFVGDLHGKWEQAEKALENDGTIIFLGDLIDSYDRDYKDHEKCYDIVLNAIRDGKARCVYGNHELSYILPSIHRCSGYTRDYQYLIDSIQPELNKHFEYYIWEPEINLLVTHAGISNALTNHVKLNLKPEHIEETVQSLVSPVDVNNPGHWVGQGRGGRRPIGGIFWCDWVSEMVPVPGLLQITGHNRGRNIRQKGTNVEETGMVYCVDCLDTNLDTFLQMEF